MAVMLLPTTVDMRRTLVMDTAIGEFIVQPTLTMVDRAIMAAGTGDGVRTQRRAPARTVTLRRRVRAICGIVLRL